MSDTKMRKDSTLLPTPRAVARFRMIPLGDPGPLSDWTTRYRFHLPSLN